MRSDPCREREKFTGGRVPDGPEHRFTIVIKTLRPATFTAGRNQLKAV